MTIACFVQGVEAASKQNPVLSPSLDVLNSNGRVKQWEYNSGTHFDQAVVGCSELVAE